MSDIKWISVATDIFNNDKILAIESLPDGTNIELVWLKLLCLAGTCNESGFLMINRNIPYTEEMMAKSFRVDLGTVQRALEVFQKMEMVEVVDDIYMIANWSKYQNSAELDHIRELNKLRQQKHRDKKKLLLTEKRNVTNNVTNNDFCSICNMSYVDVYITVINYLNSKINSKYKYTTKKNQSLIHARTQEGFNIDDFKAVIDKKAAEWMGTNMEKYLRPETLFGTKFESYLNQNIKPNTENNTDWSNVH
jgi:uncharacterized phage protein (TIGR02220 family)/predicted phage replisome organizer